MKITINGVEREIGPYAGLRWADLHGANLGGADLHGADLRGVDLHGANLHGVDLHGADLHGANLGGANLGGADLHGANLGGANLHGADLHGANLGGADLHEADLHGANLHGADLHGANLHGADLHGANLGGADLHEVDLGGADLHEADLGGANLHGAHLRGAVHIPPLCAARLCVAPPEGSFIAWKKTWNAIVKLSIPADAARSNGTERKCRAAFVDVLEIYWRPEFVSGLRALSLYDMKTEYIVGQRVVADAFDTDRWNTCGSGIHFYMTREEAEAH